MTMENNNEKFQFTMFASIKSYCIQILFVGFFWWIVYELCVNAHYFRYIFISNKDNLNENIQLRFCPIFLFLISRLLINFYFQDIFSFGKNWFGCFYKSKDMLGSADKSISF